jgi:hypothetical protein
MIEGTTVRGILLLAATAVLTGTSQARGADIDLSKATVVVESRSGSEAESTVAAVLVEEVERRTGIRLAVTKTRPDRGAAIVVTTIAPMRSVGAEGGAPCGVRRATAE